MDFRGLPLFKNFQLEGFFSCRLIIWCIKNYFKVRIPVNNMHSIHSWKILMASSVWSHRWDFGLVPERIAFISLRPQHIVHWPSLSSFKFQRDCFSLKDIDCKMSFCSIVLCCKFSCTPIHAQMNSGLKKSLIWDKYIFIQGKDIFMSSWPMGRAKASHF